MWPKYCRNTVAVLTERVRSVGGRLIDHFAAPRTLYESCTLIPTIGIYYLFWSQSSGIRLLDSGLDDVHDDWSDLNELRRFPLAF